VQNREGFPKAEQELILYPVKQEKVFRLHVKYGSGLSIAIHVHVCFTTDVIRQCLWYIYVSGFAKRDHLGRTSDFELGIWQESTSDELPFALYCTALACSVAEICLRKAWKGKKYVFEKTAQNIYFR